MYSLPSGIFYDDSSIKRLYCLCNKFRNALQAMSGIVIDDYVHIMNIAYKVIKCVSR